MPTTSQLSHPPPLLQIPRIDIGAPANAIEYHPALLAHADESAGAAEPTAPLESQDIPIPSTTGDGIEYYSDVDDSDLSDEDGLLSDASLDLDSDESEVGESENMSPAEQAESEKFGAEYDGPKFSNSEAARLLNLMLHASTCPCRYVAFTNTSVVVARSVPSYAFLSLLHFADTRTRIITTSVEVPSG